MSKKFTELNAGTIGAGSIFAQAQEPALSGDPYTSTKVSATQMANYVAKGQAFPELDNHTIIQALTGGSGAGTVILTMAQYLALTPAQQTDGHIYVISDFACLFCYRRQYRAMQKLAQAEYNQLSTAEKNDGTLYIITDATTSIGDADDVDLTGLAAGNILRAVSDGQGGIIFKPFVFNVSTSDNNKLLVVSVSGSDISVGALTPTTVILDSSTMTFDTGVSLHNQNYVISVGPVHYLYYSIKIVGATQGSRVSIANYLPNVTTKGGGDTGYLDGKYQQVSIDSGNMNIYPLNSGTTYAIGTITFIS